MQIGNNLNRKNGKRTESGQTTTTLLTVRSMRHAPGHCLRLLDTSIRTMQFDAYVRVTLTQALLIAVVLRRPVFPFAFPALFSQLSFPPLVSRE